MNTSRPPPPGAPPAYSISRIYRKNMRPIVLLVATISAIWALFSAINSFQDLNIAQSQAVPKLAPVSIALGVLYLVGTLIEGFGVFSAFTQRLALVRLYAWGSVLAVLIAIGSSLLRTIMHFTLKNDLIRECTDVATGLRVTYSYGIWGPRTSRTLTPAEAANWCNSAWSHDSFTEIITFLIMGFLSILFASIAFGYYRQLLDPTSPANFLRAPSNQVRMGLYPAPYSPSYAHPAGMPNLGYNYPPPPGAPHDRDEGFVPPYDDAKLPGYGAGIGRDDKLDQDKRDDGFRGGPSSPVERDVTSSAARGRGERAGYDV